MSTRQGHALENPKKILEKTYFSFLSRNSKFIEKHELLFWFIYLFEVQIRIHILRKFKWTVGMQRQFISWILFLYQPP